MELLLARPVFISHDGFTKEKYRISERDSGDVAESANSSIEKSDFRPGECYR